MFHILIDKSTPPYLVNFNGSVSTMECGLKGGEVREAISRDRVNLYKNRGSLKVKNLCKSCARKLGISTYQKEDQE
jgi:hypothetical protein